MATLQKQDPIVLQVIELATFVQHLLRSHYAPTNLIVCSSQDDFLKLLQASIHYEKEIERLQAETEGLVSAQVKRIAARLHELLLPTIQQLFSSRTITVTFCATLPQLQAYLAVHGVKAEPTEIESNKENTNKISVLAMLNPIALHRGTSSFSAQGLSRTFASAVEAAMRSDQKLMLVECVSRLPNSDNIELTEGADVMEQTHERHDESTGRNEEEIRDPWEAHVAILNVTTKSFGAGERGWVGRTVTVRKIAERWCTFESWRE